MKTNYITFLGPVGATFSHDAYNQLAGIHGAPQKGVYVPAATNSEVIGKVIGRGGYGAIAMETLAEGRVAEPLESFIDLLKTYGGTAECPIHIVGAVKMRLHFCLMAKPGVGLDSIVRVLAHAKGLGACKKRLAVMNALTVAVSSNGEAAREVAQSDGYATPAALGPRSAAEKYGLQILDEAFEDGVAVTTFFLLAPKTHKVSVGKENRALIIFRAPHSPGALVRSLLPFDEEGLNLIQIHSMHVGNHTYDFAIEVEVEERQMEGFGRAMEKFKAHVERHICFGPFQVVSG